MVRAHHSTECSPLRGTHRYQTIVFFGNNARVGPEPEWKLIIRPGTGIRRIADIGAVWYWHCRTRLRSQFSQSGQSAIPEPRRHHSARVEHPLRKGRTTVRGGNSDQTPHAQVRIEMSNEISGVQSAHAVANQYKGLGVAAKELPGKRVRPFRNGSRSRRFRYKGNNLHVKQGFLYAAKIFDRAAMRKAKKPVQQDKLGRNHESHFYNLRGQYP